MRKQRSNNDKDVLEPAQGTVSWESPANIAIIKYWGKYPVQLPMNPSLSFVLKNSRVKIRMDYSIHPSDDFRLDDFSINGNPHHAFKQRIAGYLKELTQYFPFLQHACLRIESTSTFPHSAGIASSAAAFSALALCLCSIDTKIRSGRSVPGNRTPGRGSASCKGSTKEGIKAATPASPDEFFHKASFMARLGSGSACRSVYDGMVVWGKTPYLQSSSDEYAVRLGDRLVHPDFFTLRDAVLIVDSREKKVSSSAGHALMHRHPYKSARKNQAGNNLERLFNALREGDFHAFGEVAENEALSLHSLMMSSDPGYTLMHPNSLRLIEKIREYRHEADIPLYFTMDAGPNVHLLYPSAYADRVLALIRGELAELCEDERWIDDAMGQGPVKLSEED
ncbi:MAG: diphosphomevalonate/mevalonate 3,5-bisphosphate decarboxylase family protein [Bacteroidales bacterium]